MLKVQKFGAIDIGSNAVRLLISSVAENPEGAPKFKKTSLVRVPIRLGADVFLTDKVSKENMQRMLDTMQAYQLLMKSHKVVSYRACATSAMRNAENGEELVALIQEKTGIQIDIINGHEEASIIALTDLKDIIKTEGVYLYVDVGGGSTEFTVYKDGKVLVSKSFRLGTVRLLNDLVSDALWSKAQEWVHKHTAEFSDVALIGSGGNINSIFKSSSVPMGKPLTIAYLRAHSHMLDSLSYEQRVVKLNLNQDRADVIGFAAKIYLSAMEWANARHIFVPKIGLADGIVKSLYNKSNS